MLKNIKIEIQVCYVNVYNILSLFQSSNITLRKYHLWLEKMFFKMLNHILIVI